MRRLLLLSVMLAACSSDADPTPAPDAAVGCSGFVGDRARSVEVEALVGEPMADYTMFTRSLPADGARVSLAPTPMGGFILLAAARAKNIDTCSISLSTGLRDTSGKIMATRRPIKMVVTGDGWAAPEATEQLGGYGLIFACPDLWSDRDVKEQPYQLEVEVTDGGGRTGKAMVSITPYCGVPFFADDCNRQCSKGGGFP